MSRKKRRWSWFQRIHRTWVVAHSWSSIAQTLTWSSISWLTSVVHWVTSSKCPASVLRSASLHRRSLLSQTTSQEIAQAIHSISSSRTSPHSSSKGYGFVGIYLRKSTWNRLAQSKSSTAFGRTTSTLCMSCVHRGRVVLCSTSQRIKSTWWRRFQRENSNHCNESLRTISSTCLSTATPWLRRSLACTRSRGAATAVALPKPVTS